MDHTHTLDSCPITPTIRTERGLWGSTGEVYSSTLGRDPGAKMRTKQGTRLIYGAGRAPRANNLRAQGWYKGGVWAERPIGKTRESSQGAGANGEAEKGEHSRLGTYKGKRGREANGPAGETEQGCICIQGQRTFLVALTRGVGTVLGTVLPVHPPGFPIWRPTSLHRPLHVLGIPEDSQYMNVPYPSLEVPASMDALCSQGPPCVPALIR